MTLLVVLKERKMGGESGEMWEPPLWSREYDCKALGCFLASCRCGHCSGAAATWDIPHMTFIQGRALTDASKQLCGTAKKGSLVTLDKARDYHINLRALPPCWKNIQGQRVRWLRRPRRAASQHNEGAAWQNARCHVHSCVYMNRWAFTANRSVTGCGLWSVDKVYKLDDACCPCRVYSGLCTRAPSHLGV